MAKTVIIPSLEADRKAIRDAIREASDCLVRIDGEKEQIKAIVEVLKEKHQLPKGYINRMIREYHKSSYDKSVAEQSDFEELYEAVIGIGE
jgi:hypothetical protein